MRTVSRGMLLQVTQHHISMQNNLQIKTRWSIQRPSNRKVYKIMWIQSWVRIVRPKRILWNMRYPIKMIILKVTKIQIVFNKMDHKKRNKALSSKRQMMAFTKIWLNILVVISRLTPITKRNSRWVKLTSRDTIPFRTANNQIKDNCQKASPRRNFTPSKTEIMATFEEIYCPQLGKMIDSRSTSKKCSNHNTNSWDLPGCIIWTITQVLLKTCIILGTSPR